MPRIVIRNIRKGKRRLALNDLNSITRKAIEKQLDDNKKVIVVSFNNVVDDWSSDVSFAGRKFISSEFLAINVFPQGSDKEVWGYVDEGTKPHRIVAKNAPLLKFQEGYQPKTLAKPARTVSGGGTATGAVVSKKAVQHPGSEARNFTGELAEDFKIPFRKVTEKTFRRVSKMVQEK